MNDRTIHGKVYLGENHHAAKLTNAQALEIYHSNEKLNALAERYGVNKTKISSIRLGFTYASVTGGIRRELPRPMRNCDKLTPSDVDEIVKMRKMGTGFSQIAEIYGLPKPTVTSCYYRYIAKANQA